MEGNGGGGKNRMEDRIIPSPSDSERKRNGRQEKHLSSRLVLAAAINGQPRIIGSSLRASARFCGLWMGV